MEMNMANICCVWLEMWLGDKQNRGRESWGWMSSVSILKPKQKPKASKGWAVCTSRQRSCLSSKGWTVCTSRQRPYLSQVEGGEFTWVPGGLWLSPYWDLESSAGHRRDITWIRSLVKAAFRGDLRDLGTTRVPWSNQEKRELGYGLTGS